MEATVNGYRVQRDQMGWEYKGTNVKGIYNVYLEYTAKSRRAAGHGMPGDRDRDG